MSGLEQAPSILAQFGELWAVIVQYFEGCAVGVVFGVVLFQLARKINANASWLVLPPVVSFVILPSIDASRVLWTAGVIATLIAVPLIGLKGPFGEFGIRDALEYRWVRIGVSLLAGLLLAQLISVVTLIVSVVILGGLASAWWKHGLCAFLQGLSD